MTHRKSQKVNKIYHDKLKAFHRRDVTDKRKREKLLQHGRPENQIPKNYSFDLLDDNFASNYATGELHKLRSKFTRYRFEVLRKKAVKSGVGIACDKTNTLLTTSNKHIRTDVNKSPMSLLELACAAVVKQLPVYSTDMLGSLHNQIAKKDVNIRAGRDLKRKKYEFSRILKNIMYQKVVLKPLVQRNYITEIQLNPKPFCEFCWNFTVAPYAKLYLCYCILCGAHSTMRSSLQYDNNFHYICCPSLSIEEESKSA